MTTRSQPMATAGHSFEADLATDASAQTKVQVCILDILRADGPLTDDELYIAYGYRSDAYPDVPMVTPQRVRTARAELTRLGHVADSGQAGLSALGNRATVWGLRIARGEAA